MDVTPSIPADRQTIDSYGPNRFRVAQTEYEGPLIVFPDRVIAWDIRDVESLAAESLAPVAAADSGVELLLIGTGARTAFVPPEIRYSVREQGVAVDFMDTGAACRTYNVLLAEGRLVAAALMPV